MKYRINRKTGDKISIIGFGSSYISESDEKNGVKALEKAYDGGINYYDLAAAENKCFPYYEKAFHSVRKNIMYQIHFGADYDKNTYGWTTDKDKIKRNIETLLKILNTDYIDYGFIHCIDEIQDWKKYNNNGAFDYLMDLKKQGVVKHIGLSSHTPKTINFILDEVSIDMLMFSINPAYDYHKGEYAKGSVDERFSIYKRCETEGIGISVMKPFSGGQLLDASISPFKESLNPYQCLQYALDKPGVLTVLPGVSSISDIEMLLGFLDASDDEKDYSIIGSFKPKEAIGKCVYCNHCKPCPSNIDIGIINKYYDLAKNGDEMAAKHYKNLSINANNCTSCGHCNERCPFDVNQVLKMKEIAAYFK